MDFEGNTMPELLVHFFDAKKSASGNILKMISDGALNEESRNDVNKFEFAFEVLEMTEAELLKEALDLLASMTCSKRCSCAGPANPYVCTKCRSMALLTAIQHEQFFDEFWNAGGE